MDREYEIEHFGFTAEQSSLERKYFLQKILNNALDAMISKFNASPDTFQVLSKTKEEVFDNIWHSMSAEIEAANNLDKKYFKIPDHVLLPPYFDHIKSYTEQNEQELDKQLEILKNNFLENSVMLTSLKVENAQYKSVSTFVDDEVKIQQQLKESFNSVNMKRIYDLVSKTKCLSTNNENSNLVAKTKNLMI